MRLSVIWYVRISLQVAARLQLSVLHQQSEKLVRILHSRIMLFPEFYFSLHFQYYTFIPSTISGILTGWNKLVEICENAKVPRTDLQVYIYEWKLVRPSLFLVLHFVVHNAYLMRRTRHGNAIKRNKKRGKEEANSPSNFTPLFAFRFTRHRLRR